MFLIWEAVKRNHSFYFQSTFLMFNKNPQNVGNTLKIKIRSFAEAIYGQAVLTPSSSV